MLERGKEGVGQGIQRGESALGVELQKLLTEAEEEVVHWILFLRDDLDGLELLEVPELVVVL